MSETAVEEPAKAERRGAEAVEMPSASAPDARAAVELPGCLTPLELASFEGLRSGAVVTGPCR